MSTTIRSDRVPPLPDEDTRPLNAAGSAVPGPYPFLRPPGAPGELGRLGGYRVLRLLGAGGMGKVFLAEDLTLQREVALKVMCLAPGDDLLNSWERFLREARALAAIKHPNLVTVYQSGQDAGTIYLAMELLEGETLEARIRREAPLPVPEILWIAEQIAIGLSAIHERGLMHRDIKPSNIWLLSTASQDTEPMSAEESARPAVSQVKILDFGLVRAVNADTQLTEAGMVVGTPSYMSPEQVRGHSLDCRTDLFSLGCVLYAMCTGRVPFDATTPMAQAVALATEEPVRVQKLNPEVPPALAELIADLLAKRPDDRPMSAEEVIDRLRTVNEPCEEQPPAESQQSFVRRHVVKFVALVWLVAAVLGAVALTRDSRPPQEQNLATPPAVPADPEVVYLVDLPRVDERIFPPPHLPQPPALTGPAVVGGVRRSHSVLVHGAPSFQQPTYIRYALDKKYSRFRAEVAMNDTASAWRTVSFVVQADGKELWRSPNLSRGQHPELCDLDVRNVNHLQLEIHTFGSEYGTHCVWIEPRLTK